VDYAIFHKKLMTNYYPGMFPECRHEKKYYEFCIDAEHCKYREDYKKDDNET